MLSWELQLLPVVYEEALKTKHVTMKKNTKPKYGKILFKIINIRIIEQTKIKSAIIV